MATQEENRAQLTLAIENQKKAQERARSLKQALRGGGVEETPSPPPGPVTS